MNLDTITAAVDAANEFLERAKKVLLTMNSDETSYSVIGTPETGALRRQSMELTRALADMRRSS